MNNEIIKSRIRQIGMKLFQVFGYHGSRNREYEFAFRNIPNERMIILDTGSIGSLFPLYLAKKGHKVYSIDTREYHEKHNNLINITGDIKKIELPDNFFDIITCISTIEHIGLSAYGDPTYDNGDVLAIKEFKRLLKKGGKLILTTPFSGTYKIAKWQNTYERIYNYENIKKIFNDWNIQKAEYYVPKNLRHWILANQEEAEQEYSIYPKSNLSCFVFIKGD